MGAKPWSSSQILAEPLPNTGPWQINAQDLCTPTRWEVLGLARSCARLYKALSSTGAGPHWLASMSLLAARCLFGRTSLVPGRVRRAPCLGFRVLSAYHIICSPDFFHAYFMFFMFIFWISCIYPNQLQLFGSKVILAATHEQALLFPWERGWAGGQFDLVKFVSRSIKKNGPYIPVKCVWWSVHGTKTKRSNNRTPQEPWTVHTNDLHPVKSINRVGGMGAFCSGELDPTYLAKMATERFETKGTKC